MDSWSIPDTELGPENTIELKVTINEGPQYRMGKLEVIASKDLAEKIQAQWKLSEGSVFDLSYPETFVSSHRQLFPKSSQPDHIQRARNCRDLTVNVRIPIDSLDPRAHAPFLETGCETEKEPKSDASQ